MIVLPLVDISKLGFWKRGSLYSISRKKRMGEVKITENTICVSRNRNTIHYYLNEIDYLEIRGDLYLEFNPLDLFNTNQQPEKIRHSGKTKFIFEIGNKKIAINFLISSKKEFQQLGEIITKWYQSNQFKIREYSEDNSRMLLLNPYLSYEQIQEVKKKLNIKSMYE